MRMIGGRWAWAAGGIAVTAALGVADAGCFSLGSDCENTLSCEGGPGGAGGQTGTGGLTGTGGQTGAGGGGAGGAATTTTTMMEPPHCGDDPLKSDSIANDCGVFVNAAAAAGGDGTREKPVTSFAKAAEILETGSVPRRIFACAVAVSETATVDLTGTRVIGGFDGCAENEWTWDGAKRTDWHGPKNVVAVRFTGGDSRVDHVDIDSPNPDADGASSIAVVVDGTGGATTLALANVKLRTGDAKAGKTGDAWAADSTLKGLDGIPGIDACGAGMVHLGGMAVTKDGCPGGTGSVSGKGGDGSSSAFQNAGNGADGAPGRPPPGKGGKGESFTGCEAGNTGADGAAGTPGAGSKEDGLISAAGFTGADGASGEAGKPGQGGGGGGGSKGQVGITCGAATNLSITGASGGSGGTGGCGGHGGNGGQAGGSSIALVVLGATVTFEAVDIDVGKGGNGGHGGAGQAGGLGGQGKAGGAGAGGPFTSASAACAGGAGGPGGWGGPGGGGRGGHAIGIAYTGMQPGIVGVTLKLPTAAEASLGGLGGPGNDANGAGAGGLVTEAYAFQ